MLKPSIPWAPGASGKTVVLYLSRPGHLGFLASDEPEAQGGPAEMPLVGAGLDQ
ncbi:Uncharacterised protein [Acinetobacter baumannii]|nr:Uncharacterised protein [Acinetobacter baumannii]